MARRTPARRPKRSASKPRRAAKRALTAKPARRRAKTSMASRARARKPAKKSARRTAPARPAAPKAPAKPQPTAKRSTRPSSAPPRSLPRPTLDRNRRTLQDIEDIAPAPVAVDDRTTAAARSGRRELKEALRQHTEGGPELTAGDLDARWDDAYAVGDEAPGGDNPTPDQDRVDDIGKALGVVYEDNEELRSGDKVADRDKHRWELDPASSEDWPHGKKS